MKHWYSPIASQPQLPRPPRDACRTDTRVWQRAARQLCRWQRQRLQTRTTHPAHSAFGGSRSKQPSLDGRCLLVDGLQHQDECVGRQRIVRVHAAVLVSDLL